MTDMIGVGNCFMLLGLSLLIFRMLWSFVFAIMHTIMSYTGGSRTSVMGLFLLAWGYFLTSQTMTVLVQVRQLQPETGISYILVCSGVLLIYILADRMGAIWVAERKLDTKMAKVVARLHWFAGGIFIYGILGMLFWPEIGHLNITGWFISTLQQLLALKFFGLIFGVFGILYIFRMLMRIIRFIRIGPKGLPPFPKSLRE